MSQSKLCKFYLGDTIYPYPIQSIPNWSDSSLEHIHDYIQWVFPLDIPSEYNPNAPILTVEDVCILRSHPEFHGRVRGIYGRMILFLSTQDCWYSNNHNMLRITRMIKSLRLMGFEHLSEDLRDFLAEMAEVHSIDKSVLIYWTDAMKTPVYIGE